MTTFNPDDIIPAEYGPGYAPGGKFHHYRIDPATGLSTLTAEQMDLHYAYLKPGKGGEKPKKKKKANASDVADINREIQHANAVLAAEAEQGGVNHGRLNGIATVYKGDEYVFFGEDLKSGSFICRNRDGAWDFRGAATMSRLEIGFAVFLMHRKSPDDNTLVLDPKGHKEWAIKMYAAAKARDMEVEGFTPKAEDEYKIQELTNYYQKHLFPTLELKGPSQKQGYNPGAPEHPGQSQPEGYEHNTPDRPGQRARIEGYDFAPRA